MGRHDASAQAIISSPSTETLRGSKESSFATRTRNRRSAAAAPALKPGVGATVLPMWLALCLAGVLVKLILLPFPVSTLGEFARWLLRLGIISAPDICFSTGLALTCGLLGKIVSRGTATARLWRRSSQGLFLLAGLYTVISLPMYRVMVVPFSIRLISFIGGPVLMWSSLKPFLVPGTLAMAVGVPAAIVLAPALAASWRRWQRVAALDWRLVAAGLVAVAGLGAVCHAYVHSHWTDRNRWERRIAHSAHWVLASSCLEELLKKEPFTTTFSFADADESDFQPRPASSANVAMPNGVERPKNILWIVMESCGIEYLSLYGSKYPTMPRLEKFVDERGLVFQNIYAQATSSCKSLVSMSASVYPRPDWLLICRDNPGFNVPTIAEVLHGHGYRSCYAHAGYWQWKGRDRFLRARGVDALIDGEAHPDRKVNSWGIEDKAMYEDVLAWIDAEPGKPFFALAYTIETHHPYVTPPVPYDFQVDDEELGRYLNSVREADAKIVWLLEQLKQRNLLDSTVVAITADHGEAFGQHGQRMHSFSLYEQDVHVPLVLLHPSLKNLPGPREAIGQHIDIAPTLVDLLGFSPAAEWQGSSLFSANRPSRAYFLSVGNEIVLGLRDGPYKYNFYVDDQREELFDLRSDLAEERNQAPREARRAAAYRQRVAGLVRYQRAFLARHGVH